MDMNNLKKGGKEVSAAVGNLFKTVKTEITTPKNPEQPKATDRLKQVVTNVTTPIKDSISSATAEKEFSEFDFNGIDMSSMKFYKSTENSGSVIYELGCLWNSEIAVFCGKKCIAIPNPFLSSSISYGVVDMYDIEALEECFEIEYPEDVEIHHFSKFTIKSIYPAKFEASYNNYLKLQKKGKIILSDYSEYLPEDEPSDFVCVDDPEFEKLSEDFTATLDDDDPDDPDD